MLPVLSVPRFEDFDLTLGEAELDDFMSFMEQRGAGGTGVGTPPDGLVGGAFPGLQMQPHDSCTPSHSEGSDAGGASSAAAAAAAAAAAVGAAGPVTSSGGSREPGPRVASDGSLTSVAVSTPAAAQMLLDQQQFQQQLQQQQQFQQPMAIKPEAAAALSPTSLPPQAPLGYMALLPASSGQGSASSLGGFVASAPGALGAQQAAAGYAAVQPMQWHPSTAVAMAAGGSAHAVSPVVSQPLAQQLVYMQAPAAAAALTALQQQQQHSLYSQLAVMQPSMCTSSAAAAMTTLQMSGGASPVGDAAAGSSRSTRQHGVDAGRASSPKLHISHSTVEKQRRDRLNSLIDELSGIVPPADSKYSNETHSVRRPKHVVLTDTIRLLKDMQSKLQLEEAEISTLKQQAAAAAVMAAGQQHPAAAMMGAPGANGAAAGASAALDGGCAVELPTAPEPGSSSTGVVVEQGIEQGCLYVKVNCKDRKGLLSDVVAALKALPVVIKTAAVTTTTDGEVHDVFEVRVEDESATPEEIQCAVQQALFARKVHSKRLRQDSLGALNTQG